MTTLFELPSAPLVPIEGRPEAFPVARLFCVGRNYAAHAREMGMDPDREPPFFFTKFGTTVVPGGGSIPYPSETADFQFEGELIIAIGREAARIPGDRALDVVLGYAVGLDMTRRDLQLEARNKGRPWDAGKNFSYSAPISPIRPVATTGHLRSGAIRLSVNGEIRQDANVADMIWDCREIIAYISRFERLLPGDLIYTGTPAGVGAVVPGDLVEVTIEGLAPLRVSIGSSEPEFA